MIALRVCLCLAVSCLLLQCKSKEEKADCSNIAIFLDGGGVAGVGDSMRLSIRLENPDQVPGQTFIKDSASGKLITLEPGASYYVKPSSIGFRNSYAAAFQNEDCGFIGSESKSVQGTLPLACALQNGQVANFGKWGSFNQSTGVQTWNGSNYKYTFTFPDDPSVFLELFFESGLKPGWEKKLTKKISAINSDEVFISFRKVDANGYSDFYYHDTQYPSMLYTYADPAGGVRIWLCGERLVELNPPYDGETISFHLLYR